MRTVMNIWAEREAGGANVWGRIMKIPCAVLTASVALLLGSMFCSASDAATRKHRFVSKTVHLTDDSRSYIVINLIINWNNSGQTLCQTYNASSRTIAGVIDLYPVDGSRDNHATAYPVMMPHRFDRIFSWPDLNPRNPVCVLTSSYYQ